MNYLRISIFGVIVLLYLWFPYNMIRRTERILKHGELYRFHLQPIDPYDAFRGRYVSLYYGDLHVPSQDTLSSNQLAYITLQRDSLGFAIFKEALAHPPENQGFLTTRIWYSNDSIATFQIPESMAYFYMNEQSAPKVEKLVLRPANPDSLETMSASVGVRILNGEAVVDQLYLNDLPAIEYLKHRK